MSTNSLPASEPITESPPGSATPADPMKQPILGLGGFALILAVGAVVLLLPGPQRALDVFGPWSTFELPVLGVIALWWANWPVASQSRLVGGVVLTCLVVVSGLALTLLGQAVVGDADPAHALSTSDQAGPPSTYLTSFPFTVPLAVAVFVTFLHLTFVCRKWPFASMAPVPGGVAAFVTSWIGGSAVYLSLANWDAVPAAGRAALGLRSPGGPVDALDLVGILLCICMLQMVIFFLLEGWPFSAIKSEPLYLLAANAVTIGGGILLWLLLHNGFDRTVPQVSMVGGLVVAGSLVTGLLFEQWPARLVGSVTGRRVALVGSVALFAVVAGFVLDAVASNAETWTRDPKELWVAVAALNFIAAGAIIHTVLWGRWPLRAPK